MRSRCLSAISSLRRYYLLKPLRQRLHRGGARPTTRRQRASLRGPRRGATSHRTARRDGRTCLRSTRISQWGTRAYGGAAHATGRYGRSAGAVRGPVRRHSRAAYRPVMDRGRSRADHTAARPTPQLHALGWPSVSSPGVERKPDQRTGDPSSAIPAGVPMGPMV